MRLHEELAKLFRGHLGETFLDAFLFPVAIPDHHLGEQLTSHAHDLDNRELHEGFAVAPPHALLADLQALSDLQGQPAAAARYGLSSGADLRGRETARNVSHVAVSCRKGGGREVVSEAVFSSSAGYGLRLVTMMNPPTKMQITDLSLSGGMKATAMQISPITHEET